MSVPVCDFASARKGRRPECLDRIWIPFDYCVAWAFDADTSWVRTLKRIIEGHSDVKHPDRPLPWPRVTPVKAGPGSVELRYEEKN